MTDLIEVDEYPAGIYQLEQTDPVLGGAPNEATKAGVDNIPHLQLAKRTRWLKTRVDQLLTKAIAATTLVAGLVRLSSATNSTSEAEAATPKAVKAAWDSAETRALKTTSVNTSGLATGGGSLSADRTINVRVATQGEAEAGILDVAAMTPLKVMQAIAVRLGGRKVEGAGLAMGGGSLSADRTITVPDATQAEAEAGTSTARAMSPLRVAQAIASRLAARSVQGSGLAIGGGPLSTDRFISVPASTQAQAQAGTDHSTAMTPLRVGQAIDARYASRNVATTGYQVLPSGLILQWGQISVDGAAASGTEDAIFPLTFPSACLQVFAHDPNSVLDATQYLVSAQDWNQTLTKISYKRVGGASSIVVINFFAIGR